MKYVYWIEGKFGGIGEYQSLEEAKKEFNSFKHDKDQKIVKHEAQQCACGRWTSKEILDNMGECLSCDHVRGDVDIEERGDDSGKDYISDNNGAGL